MPGTPKKKSRLEPESIRDIVAAVIARMTPQARRVGVALESDLAPGRLCALCDRFEVEEALGVAIADAVDRGAATIVCVTGRVEGIRLIVEVHAAGTLALGLDLECTGGCGG